MDLDAADTDDHGQDVEDDESDGDEDVEVDDEGQGVENDESEVEGQDDAGSGRVARLHPREVRAYLVEHHGEQRQRLRHLAYNGSAAGAGWAFGWEGSLHSALVECGHDTGDTMSAVILGVGVILAAVILVDRRTRGWYAPLAWACRIPLASAVLALALYTPSTIR